MSPRIGRSATGCVTFARTRLRHPGADAYLAEILAAESDY